MDEISGRRTAANMGLKIMGSIGVLTAAFREGYLNNNEAAESFQKIRDANRHISESLIKDAPEIIRGEK